MASGSRAVSSSSSSMSQSVSYGSSSSISLLNEDVGMWPLELACPLATPFACPFSWPKDDMPKTGLGAPDREGWDNTGLFDRVSVEKRSGADSANGVACREESSEEWSDGGTEGRKEYCGIKQTEGGRSILRIVIERMRICQRHNIRPIQVVQLIRPTQSSRRRERRKYH